MLLTCFCISLLVSFLSLIMVMVNHFTHPSVIVQDEPQLQLPVETGSTLFPDAAAVQVRLEKEMELYLQKLGQDCSNIAIAIESGDDQVQYIYNENAVFEAASLYKIPLAMYYCDQIEATPLTLQSTLEFTEDALRLEGWNPIGEVYGIGSEVPLQEALESSLTNSDNIAAAILYNHLGGWEEFAQIQQQYSSSAAKPTEPLDNVCTVKQVMDELRLIQQNPARYGLIIQALSEAQDDEYLNERIPNGTMGQKYGQIDGFTNAAGFSKTGVPYRIVVLSNTGQCDQDAGNINEIVWHVFNEAVGNSVENIAPSQENNEEIQENIEGTLEIEMVEE